MTARRAIIFANGRLDDPQDVRKYLEPADLLVAADGGARHCQAAGLQPHILVGDFDSLTEAEAAAMQAAGVQVVRHPARKDYTDLELALQVAAQAGCRQALVFGALGGRWDQSIANLLLPAAPGLEALDVRLVDGPQQIALLRSGQSRRITGRPGETVSLIPIGGDAGGVSTSGLEFPLQGEDLLFGATRGISNQLVAEHASVSLERGLLLVLQSPAEV